MRNQNTFVKMRNFSPARGQNASVRGIVIIVHCQVTELKASLCLCFAFILLAWLVIFYPSLDSMLSQVNVLFVWQLTPSFPSLWNMHVGSALRKSLFQGRISPFLISFVVKITTYLFAAPVHQQILGIFKEKNVYLYSFSLCIFADASLLNVSVGMHVKLSK